MLLNFFKALANESRLKLVGILAQRECSVEELAALLRLKEPTVSHHLNKLKALNLVQMRSQGNTHLYRLDPEELQRLNQMLLTAEQVLTAEVDGTAWEEKVLQSFLVDGRLKEIPASRKKRLVVLQWLVRKFEPDRIYSERSLNEILQRYHSDSATLRREFIGYRLMARDRGQYWRLPESEWKVEASAKRAADLDA
ncbi:metalloregulator ArsR/SmtB family transcription factor [Microcoleus sp. FACHB-1515]|uniref:DUF2087 domain-containing protein n=1 Tax=Cyanophyceae TaxID=3028117 RepID=UPI0018EF7583|nr:metalloregulator ArsR/SmtB family transcription factor [Microcoleus sp. FACHB-1515]